jgi:hypothetical protein
MRPLQPCGEAHERPRKEEEEKGDAHEEEVHAEKLERCPLRAPTIPTDPA